MAIKHISLDFWNTIGIPNSTYAIQRTELIAEALRIPVLEAKEKYTKVKK